MPVAAVPRRAQLGLRRRVPVRRAVDATAAPTACAASSTPCHRRGLVGGARRRLQPPRPGRQRARRVRPVLHRPVPHAVGRRPQLRRRRSATKCATSSSRTRSSGSPTSGSTRCGSTRCTRSPTPARIRSWKSSSTRCTRCARANRAPHLGDRRERRQRRAADHAEANAAASGCDAQWNDDFHHALHALLTGERDDYYADFGAVGGSRHRVPRGLRLRRTATRSSAATGTAARPAGAAGRALRRVRPEPRSGRQPRARRSPDDARRPGATASSRPRPCCSRRSCRCCSWARSTARRSPFPYFVDHSRSRV